MLLLLLLSLLVLLLLSIIRLSFGTAANRFWTSFIDAAKLSVDIDADIVADTKHSTTIAITLRLNMLNKLFWWKLQINRRKNIANFIENVLEFVPKSLKSIRMCHHILVLRQYFSYNNCVLSSRVHAIKVDHEFHGISQMLFCFMSLLEHFKCKFCTQRIISIWWRF